MNAFFSFFGFRGYSPLEVIVELTIIWVAVYLVFRFLRRTSGAGVIRGFAVMLLLVVLALRLPGDTGEVFGRLRFIADKLIGLVAILLVVVFQPELRQALISLGRAKFLQRNVPIRRRVVKAVSDAVDFLSKSQFGAIIVIERSLGLDNLMRAGVSLDSQVDARMLQAIFWPNSPLHDLAVVIRGDRVAAANVQLPLAPAGVVPSRLGSRHRAGVGVTLESDCLVVVVSEETGNIRLAAGGELSAPIPRDKFEAELAHRLSLPPEDPQAPLAPDSTEHSA
ncbi:MAG: diadenylate cyclase [Phycisphaerales bacterium]|nr:diadenylate cyclase [Phycisphaerales bacterium]